ncbi:MAG: tRNA guanosine(34) transglycosylase Tgt [Microcystis aeruginosa Ma_QC_Ch_20071001_S25]|uniref:Queuine tRNA-ribosyltransferase n=1 Tax=Microcystis aeruginosa Ma_QC_Ch_20071001_S25D TaxID=2486250 RepID=A0A552FY08_MICAE|nr:MULTISPECIES: tRNA guanosine(34) transglycosylase Tgt [unclassified Microcystis]MCA2762402.1 tRNA guanosine(34) transglycosylase Tgt [Microcystis sp. M151S2]NCS52540.1 tRNA guanosine(34) transglycosylase Tgt [Microcystis aeruginosa G13-05]TRU44821.1 MAG: tRNA guanosine(34) transglycosylase Tgt [Microcystis aeruginosa Ma_QC_Ch_20071001_S25]TRU51619.1 MAG: tRNA guanosine(34) transglycosylase Tgt [Microcystis aeruginosa Ma_QC_Ch_20071001_S25D]TRU56179.1 MAG: tRNA guanosine(34) transglycosylase
MGFSFELIARCPQTGARVGVWHTPHGPVETPRFMPVGTLATVKGLTPAQIASTGAQMILANTYHLHLQPGESIIEKAGGLHEFMAWNQPILTDSGGFQVFSLSQLRQIKESGVTFRSPRDGRIIEITPEKSIQIQNALGADVIMAFDECPPTGVSHETMKASIERTYRWLERCLRAHQRPQQQALFAIVQGGIYEDLRAAAAESLVKLDLPGYAIGGVSVGEETSLIHRIVQITAPLLPENKPRYLMGVGTYREMAKAIASGIDLFDCVIPTRFGRHGTALVRGERWNLKNARFKEDFAPLDETCPCYTCQHFSRAYLNHLIKSGEMLGYILLSLHNIAELIRFTREIRQSILEGTFAQDFAPWLEDALDVTST